MSSLSKVRSLIFLWAALAQNASWPDWAHEHSRTSSERCQSCERDDQGCIARSRRARAAFRRNNPCPATGESKGPCAGYVIDRIKPLACGGEDEPGNMQWQTRAAAKAKDRWEGNGCTKSRRDQLFIASARRLRAWRSVLRISFNSGVSFLPNPSLTSSLPASMRTARNSLFERSRAAILS